MHDQDHDGNRRDAVDDGAEDQRLDWIERGKIEERPHKRRAGNRQIERRRPARALRQPDAPAERLAKRTQDPEGPPFRERGFDVLFQIPVFDGGEVRVRQAAETYNLAFNRLTEKAVNVRSEARDAYQVYRSTYDIAGYYQREVLPIRKIITEETQLRFSAMQIDVFALLIEARQRLAVLRAAIEAKRAFWLAKADLQAILDHVPARITSWNRDWTNCFANRVAEKQFGIEPGSATVVPAGL